MPSQFCSTSAVSPPGRRSLYPDPLAVYPHRPRRHLVVAVTVVHLLHDAARLEFGSFCSSSVSNTAPAGTPTAISFSITWRLSCRRVQSPMIASSSFSSPTGTSRVAKSRIVDQLLAADQLHQPGQCSGLARLVVR